MRTQDFVRAAAGVLATALFAAAGAQAQDKLPEPLTMTDTAPTPASDRTSVGAVIMMDQPVLAQREALLAAQERTAVDTRSMGAGPARILQDVMTQEQLKRQRELELRQGSRPSQD
jgi:hypothetical protein